MDHSPCIVICVIFPDSCVNSSTTLQINFLVAFKWIQYEPKHTCRPAHNVHSIHTNTDNTTSHTHRHDPSLHALCAVMKIFFSQSYVPRVYSFYHKHPHITHVQCNAAGQLGSTGHRGPLQYTCFQTWIFLRIHYPNQIIISSADSENFECIPTFHSHLGNTLHHEIWYPPAAYQHIRTSQLINESMTIMCHPVTHRLCPPQPGNRSHC